MNRQALSEKQRQLTRLFIKYRYFLLVLFLGVALMLWSGRGAATPAEQSDSGTEEKAETVTFDLVSCEDELQNMLEQIDGAGKVSVSLSLASTGEIVYAADVRQSQQNGDSSSYESALTVLSDGSYGQRPVETKTIYPVFRGAVVLCEGADQDTVRLAVTQAVATYCDLGSDRIAVLHMERQTD